MGVAEFFCNFCFSIHYMVRFVDVYAYTTGWMSCARIFDTSIPRSKNPTITEDLMESTVEKESISKSPTRQRIREKIILGELTTASMCGAMPSNRKNTHCPNTSCWVAERPSLVPNIVRLRLQAHHPQKLPVKKKQPLIWLRLWDG